MSYPGYPPYQGNPNSQPNSGAPYPSNPSPYPPQGVYPPSVGYSHGSPMYMPQPYGSAGGGYPPATPNTVGSSPYPQQSYPQSQGSYYPSNNVPSYPNQANTQYPAMPRQQIPSHYPNQSNTQYPAGQGQYGHTPNYSQNTNHHQQFNKLSPTVVPAHPFNPREDAEVLRKAMKGFGTDEKAIINVLTRRSNSQRLEISVQFKTLYGKDLIKDLKSEISGNFENLVVAMMTPLPQFYAKEIHDALSGLGTDETVLIEVMCTLSNSEIRCIREAYHKTYYQNLESDLKGDTGGHFKRLMVSLCNAGRDEGMQVNPQAASADAQALLRAGELRVGTDESTFNMILCQRNRAQLRAIFDEYQRLTGHDFEKAIKKEFSGDIEDGLLAVVRSIRNQSLFFAKCFNKSLKGMGTNDRDLIRLAVTRSEIDMGDIKREYASKYGESLGDAIKGDCSGDYKKCLLALIGES